MNENQNYNDDNVKVREGMYTNCPDKRSFWRTLLTGLMTFLGAFCAFYVVADWHYKRMIAPPFIPHSKMEKMMKKDMYMMNKMMKKEGIYSRNAAHVIHLEQNDNAYKIFIDLRAFDNNENNVQVTTNGNVLTINGRSVKKSKNNEQIAEFQQNYLFGNNVKLSDLTKTTNGNYYIVTIPTGNPSEDEEDID
ncbi:MAG: Hsp20 family protein [Cyanobacteria bacterium SIG26]|nr:Hsp20 family protein [Cyanobacteria bacterium SIG26]MBQ7127246.1 Hsp20/alpha crystallin family protein [bacterium]